MGNKNAKPIMTIGWLIKGVVAILFVFGIGLFGSGVWIKAKAQLSQILLDRSFEKSIASGTPQKPWHWADMTPLARISAERLGQSNIVLASASGQALAFGPGHLSDTPLPGSTGTSVLAAHRDTHFSWIQHLRPGDQIDLKLVDGSEKKFSIRRAWIAPYNASGIYSDVDETLLALTTCYPFDTNTPGDERYIVEAELVAHQ